MKKNNSFHQFILKLAEEKKVSEKEIQELVIESFYKSYRAEENVNARLRFRLNSEAMEVYRSYQIVEKISDPETEVIKNSKLLRAGRVENGFLLLPIDIRNLSFSFNQKFEKFLQEELENIGYQKEKDKALKILPGQLINGKIKFFEEDNCLIELESKNIGYWKKEEWVAKKNFFYSRHPFYFLVKEISTKENTTKIILTRNDDSFLHKILEEEVNEIKSGAVVIRYILRIQLPTMLLSKIVVESKRKEVNPLGACIGKEQKRIISILRFAYPEKVEIIPWSEEKTSYFFNLLLPIKPDRLVIKSEKEWLVTIISASREEKNIQTVVKEVANHLGININVSIDTSKQSSEILDEPHQERKIIKEIGSYKNIFMRILEEISDKRRR